MPPARGTKTLGWFMDQTDLLKGQQPGGGAGPGAIGQHRRGSGSSDVPDSKSTTPSSLLHQQFYTHSTTVPSHHQHHQQKKQKKYRKTVVSASGATTRKEAFQTGAVGGMSSESSEDGVSTPLPPPVSLTSSAGTAALPATSSNGAQSEEYWFYDVATDGYYYEQNGAKGWRRRQPNSAVLKGNGKDQEVAHMNVNGPSKYNQLLAAQAAAAQAAFFQQALHFQAQAHLNSPTPPPPQSSGAPQNSQQQQQNPTMRYYDPSSDGFFYEMASVDGWKRRQPNKPVSAQGITRPYGQRAEMGGAYSRPPPPPTSSYGAALARGQFPRNTVKQEDTASPPLAESSSSSQCGDTFAELFNSADPVFNPIQRPSALNLEQKAVSPQLENAPNSTAALFDAVLADFNGGKTNSSPSNLNAILPGAATQNPSSQSPMKESWNSFRSCSLFSPIRPSKRVLAPSGPFASQPMGVVSSNTPLIDDMDDDTMKMLLRDLDKLWANTPVSGLNQA